MHIYLMENANDVGYDEWEGFVVVAANRKQALEVAVNHYQYNADGDFKNMVDERIRDYSWDYRIIGESRRKTPTLILSSFNAA